MAVSENAIITCFHSACLNRYKQISNIVSINFEDPETKYRYIPTSLSYYWKRRHDLTEFIRKCAPVCAWLRVSQKTEQSKHKIYVTNFSPICDAIMSSGLDHSNIPDLIFTIMLINLKCGILLPKTDKEQKNIFRKIANIIIGHTNLPSIMGFNEAVDWFIEEIEMTSGVIPSDLYGSIRRFREVQQAYGIISRCLPQGKNISKVSLDYLMSALLNIEEGSTTKPKISLEELETCLELLNVSNDVSKIIIRSIRAQQQTKLNRQAHEKERKEISAKRAMILMLQQQQYNKNSDDALRAAKNKDSNQLRLLRVFNRNNQKSYTLNEVIGITKEAYKYDIHDYWPLDELPDELGNTKLDVFLANYFGSLEDGGITEIESLIAYMSDITGNLKASGSFIINDTTTAIEALIKIAIDTDLVQEGASSIDILREVIKFIARTLVEKELQAAQPEDENSQHFSL